MFQTVGNQMLLVKCCSSCSVCVTEVNAREAFPTRLSIDTFKFTDTDSERLNNNLSVLWYKSVMVYVDYIGEKRISNSIKHFILFC